MQDKFTKILKAISDPTRREIFHALILVSVALPINQIATNFNMTRQGVTKHLKVLELHGSGQQLLRTTLVAIFVPMLDMP